MSTVNQHIQNIKLEIAKMQLDGHLVDFEVIGCSCAIEHELDQIALRNKELETLE